ncbi:MAG: hypothetical protein AAF593_00245 [Planctomycetota bacterium]
MADTPEQTAADAITNAIANNPDPTVRSHKTPIGTETERHDILRTIDAQQKLEQAAARKTRSPFKPVRFGRTL